MSLRARLLMLIGVALLLLWSATAVWSLRDLDRTLQHTLDERLAMSARMVARLVSQFPGGVSSIDAQDSLLVSGSDGMACQIRSLRGEIVATTLDSGVAIKTPALGYQTVFLDGHQWRTYTLRADDFVITTADRLDERAVLREQIALAAGVPFLVAILGGLVALWLGVGRALAPLRGLQAELRNRSSEVLEPVAAGRLPIELQPLMAALNGLLQRVAKSVQRERNFTSNAAHELRTPLTAVDTHLQVARITSGDAAEQAMADASRGVARMRETLDQLLMLSRVEGDTAYDDGERIDGRTAVERATRAVGEDQGNRIRVSINEGDSLLLVPAALAVVALRNLIDNALKYSPVNEPVEIHVDKREFAVHFQVQDKGRGMSDEEIASATERFWRGRQTGKGIGLGLALARAVADRFGGSLHLARNPHGGLLVELVLPACERC